MTSPMRAISASVTLAVFITDAMARRGLKEPFTAASGSWIDVLENAGVEAVHWSAIGVKDASDIEIMIDAKA